LLGKDEVDWIYNAVMENEKAIADAIDFAVSHPESYIVISIGGRHSISYEDSSVGYVIEVTEIDLDDKDMYQVLGQIEPTNYSADIIRIEKEGEEREGKKKMLVGRVYL
jgi:predicted protein tyrosine phosphatase